MRYSLAYTVEQFSHGEIALAVIQELLSALHKKTSGLMSSPISLLQDY